MSAELSAHETLSEILSFIFISDRPWTIRLILWTSH